MFPTNTVGRVTRRVATQPPVDTRPASQKQARPTDHAARISVLIVSLVLVTVVVLQSKPAVWIASAAPSLQRLEFPAGSLSASVPSHDLFLPLLSIPEPVLLHAPYVQNVTATSAVIAWSTDLSAAAEVRYSADQSYNLVAAASSRLVNGTTYYAAALTGLQPATQYNYRVYTRGSDLTPWSQVAFKTATTGDSFSFVAFGDSRDGSQAAFDVANQIARRPADLILHVGDTVGLPGSYTLYDQQYFRVYRNLAAKLPIYITPGNHEYEAGNPPQPFLDNFYFPTDGPAGLKGRAYSFDWGNAHFVAVDTNVAYVPGSPQYAWLQNDLASTNKLWKVVWLHFPPYSSGVEGTDGIPVRNALGPLFDQYGVDLVFAGHSHNYERSYPMRGGQVAPIGQHGTIYFVTGGGGAPLYAVNGDFWTANKAQVYEFTHTTIQGCQLTTQAIDSAGQVFDSVSLNKCAAVPVAGNSNAAPATAPTEVTVSGPAASSLVRAAASTTPGDGVTRERAITRATPMPATAVPVAPTPAPVAPTATPLPGGTTAAPLGQSGAWNLIFNDDFNGPGLDTSKWDTCYPWQPGTCTNESNAELQLYNKDDVLADPGAGILRLRAQKRDLVGWNGQTFHYTSAIITTGGIDGGRGAPFSFTYGYAEARVKVPAGRGLWPAFWLLPTTYAWPPEIDVMEVLGHEPAVDHMTYHWAGPGSSDDHPEGATFAGANFAAGYHVVGVSWTRDAIVWYVDGIERFRYSQPANIYNQPMYLLFDLAVGGNWPGAPDGSTAFPAYFDIDYVRVWQRR